MFTTPLLENSVYFPGEFDHQNQNLFEDDSNDYKFFVDSRQGDLLKSFESRESCISSTIIRPVTQFYSTGSHDFTNCSNYALYYISGGLILVLIGGGILSDYQFNRKNISEKIGNLQIIGQSDKVINDASPELNQ